MGELSSNLLKVGGQKAETPADVIARVSRIVTRSVDRVTGDRSEVPLLVATAVVEALKPFNIAARVVYGPAAWIEVLEDMTLMWGGCWGQSFHFWATTAFGEVVDLTTSVAHRKRSHLNPQLVARYSPPMVWSKDVPLFYRYRPEGVAEIELQDSRDQKFLERVLRDVREHGALPLASGAEEFPNEPILCPGRRILDDSRGTFKQFERALGVAGREVLSTPPPDLR